MHATTAWGRLYSSAQVLCDKSFLLRSPSGIQALLWDVLCPQQQVMLYFPKKE